MRFTSTIVAAALSLAAGCQAWTKDSNGVWTANNDFYRINGVWAHESCTYMNTDNIHKSGDFCSFWTDAQGHTFQGHCTSQVPGQVLCL